MFGVWNVTTHSGGSQTPAKKLGTYEGFLDEIARSLSSKAGYALIFKRVTKAPDYRDDGNARSEVELLFDTAAGLGNTKMSDEQRVASVREFLKGRPVLVENAPGFHMVKLVWKED